MHRIRIAPVARLLMTPTVKNNLYYGSANFSKVVTPTCSLAFSFMRDFHSTSPSYRVLRKINIAPIGFFQRIKMKFKDHLNPARYRLKATGYFLYEGTVDTLDYNKFYKEFKMPDTFYSWFVITELHVWMLMVRCMAEGKDGNLVRNSIVEAMWADVLRRGSQLGTKEVPVNQKIVKKQINLLSTQFNACVIAYDEGITGEDKVLAAAIWRRFLLSECNNPELLEEVVFYVRKQICLLDNTPWKEILVKRTVSWKGLDLVKSK